MPASAVHGIFDEIAAAAEAAIATATKALPAGFPETLTSSIVGGLRSRLKLLEQRNADAAE